MLAPAHGMWKFVEFRTHEQSLRVYFDRAYVRQRMVCESLCRFKSNRDLNPCDGGLFVGTRTPVEQLSKQRVRACGVSHP